MKIAKAFRGYKVGTKVHDTWYGNGKVIKRTPRRLHIKLVSETEVWAYDSDHVKTFVRKGHKRGNIQMR
ncbi:MAG TPA: hypothetical protein DDY18_11835 [Flavobacterium sp.]|jgi:hypothetical protein|nr:hypothetical protein [Flavobacterium sp.]